MISYKDAVVLGLPLDFYSTILAIAVLFLAVVTVLHFVGYIFCSKIRQNTQKIGYFGIMSIIGVLAFISTLGALVYQFGYGLVVCELCWWQRIFMFPIEFIVLSTIVHRSHGNDLAIRILSAFGIFFAGYHYWLHFRSWVQKDDMIELGFTDCSQGGILPTCTDPTGVVEFGFLTIPFMALVAFVAIFWLTFVASGASKNHQ